MPAKPNYQTLLCAKTKELYIAKGCTEHAVETMCNDRERAPPTNERYVLASVRNVHYQENMTQKEVW